MFRLFLALSFITTAGCASYGYAPGDQAPQDIRKRVKIAKSASSCQSSGGHWYAVNNPAIFPLGGFCQFKAADAGQHCKASRDCEGYCEMSSDDFQGQSTPRCSAQVPPSWQRCVPGYFENGKVIGRGECFGEDSEVQ